MEEKKTKKLDLQSKLLIAAAVVIAGLICYMCIEKVIDNKNVAAYETKIVELQQTIGRLYKEMYLGSGESEDDTDKAENDEDYWYNAWTQYNDELNSLYYADEDITDTMAKILFIRGINKMWAQNISDLTKYPIAEPRVTTEVDGRIYVKRDVQYADVVKEYSRIFTGDLLEERLNERFIEIDGYLYVAAGGEDVGESVVNVEVTKVSESNGEFTYSVKYNLEAENGDLSDYRTCTIVIKSVGNSYAISSLEFDEVEEDEEDQDEAEQVTDEQNDAEQEVTEPNDAE